MIRILFLTELLNFIKASFYLRLIILCLLFFHINISHRAICTEIQDEPRLYLNVKNEPLDSVLNKIAEDTDFEFNINNKWKTHPVSASLKGIPLYQGLKLILRGLNHAIIYESDKCIKIVISGKIEPHKKYTNYNRHIPKMNQNNQFISATPSEPSHEAIDESLDEDDKSEDISSIESAEDESTENEIPQMANSENEEYPEKTGPTTNEEIEQISDDSSENPIEQEQNDR